MFSNRFGCYLTFIRPCICIFQKTTSVPVSLAVGQALPVSMETASLRAFAALGGQAVV
jgi:hypothetical protein